MLLGIGRWRSACSRVVRLPIGVVCCQGTHRSSNCTLDISPCVGKFKQECVANYTADSIPYVSSCVWITWQHNTGYFDDTDWNTSYSDHVTTQGTFITMTWEVTCITWLKHKALEPQWLEYKLLGSHDNTRHFYHNDWRSYLHNVTKTQGTWITMTGIQVTWITWQHKALVSQWLEHKLLGSRYYNTRHLDHVTTIRSTRIIMNGTTDAWITWMQHKLHVIL